MNPLAYPRRVASQVDRSAQQLVVLAEVSAELRCAEVDHWLGGGWGDRFPRRTHQP
jgi:hypothetical protein